MRLNPALFFNVHVSSYIFILYLFMACDGQPGQDRSQVKLMVDGELLPEHGQLRRCADIFARTQSAPAVWA